MTALVRRYGADSPVRASVPGDAPTAHAASHQNGGSDEISVAGLSGSLADPQTPTAHAASHQNGGGDEVATATPGANAIPKADGSGKLAAGWLQGVLALADLSDVTAKTGAGTVVVMDDTPTIIEPVLDTPSIADFTNATHNHSNNTNGGTLLVSAIAFTATDKVLGRSTSGAGAGEEIACTSAGRALMDDSTAFAQRNTLGLYEAYITSDVTTTSASAGDITGLSFSIGASEVWEFSAHLMTKCSTANGHKWAVNIPASCAIAGSLRGSRASAASVIADDIVADDTLSITLGTGTYTTGGWIDMFCIVTNSTNAGTVQLRFAAAVGGDTITVKGPGSYLKARRIA